jgi:hypothetical protein
MSHAVRYISDCKGRNLRHLAIVGLYYRKRALTYTLWPLLRGHVSWGNVGEERAANVANYDLLSGRVSITCITLGIVI